MQKLFTIVHKNCDGCKKKYIVQDTKNERAKPRELELDKASF